MGKTRKLPKAVRSDEWQKLIKVIPQKDKISLVAFLLAYGSGMRLSEVLRCRREHFKENGGIFIPQSKYGVERVVPAPKGWRETFFKELPIKLGERALQKRFKKYNALANLNEKYTFHSLRHGFATRMIENGVPINQVQLALGHSNVSTTSIYTKASPMDLIKSYNEKF